MERGPVMLSWQHIANAHENTARGHNVVVHEFVHKLDMRSGNANGCPPCLQASWAHARAAGRMKPGGMRGSRLPGLSRARDPGRAFWR